MNNISNTLVISGAIDYGPSSTVKLSKVSTNLGAQSYLDGKDYVEVPQVRLSDQLERHKIGQYALVSDIEGAEVDLLRKDFNALYRCKFILIELHDPVIDGRWYSIPQIKRMITDLGFTLIYEYGVCAAFKRTDQEVI